MSDTLPYVVSSKVQHKLIHRRAAWLRHNGIACGEAARRKAVDDIEATLNAIRALPAASQMIVWLNEMAARIDGRSEKKRRVREKATARVSAFVKKLDAA